MNTHHRKRKRQGPAKKMPQWNKVTFSIFNKQTLCFLYGPHCSLLPSNLPFPCAKIAASLTNVREAFSTKNSLHSPEMNGPMLGDTTSTLCIHLSSMVPCSFSNGILLNTINTSAYVAPFSHHSAVFKCTSRDLHAIISLRFRAPSLPPRLSTLHEQRTSSTTINGLLTTSHWTPNFRGRTTKMTST